MGDAQAQYAFVPTSHHVQHLADGRLRADRLPQTGRRWIRLAQDLEPEPAVLTGALVGYSRVSTRDQNLDRQTDALTAAGCLRIFADERSGKTSARTELAKALDFMRPGTPWWWPAWTVFPARCRTSSPSSPSCAGGASASGPSRAARHHHSRRAPGLPRLRRSGRVHPGADRRVNPGGAGRGPGPGPGRRPPPGYDPGEWSGSAAAPSTPTWTPSQRKPQADDEALGAVRDADHGRGRLRRRRAPSGGHLPEEIRQDRDDRGHFLVYDERFVRRSGDEQPQTDASCVAEPYWEHERFRVGPPVNWTEALEWQEVFDLTEAGDRHGEPRR